MRQKVFSVKVGCKQDMAKLESVVGGLLGGEQNKCSFVRSQDFVNLRLCALYNRGETPLSIYGENIQISLDTEKNVTVYMLSTGVDEADHILGKRAHESEQDQEI
jgi:hypothetical protein